MKCSNCNREVSIHDLIFGAFIVNEFDEKASHGGSSCIYCTPPPQDRGNLTCSPEFKEFATDEISDTIKEDPDWVTWFIVDVLYGDIKRRNAALDGLDSEICSAWKDANRSGELQDH